MSVDLSAVQADLQMQGLDAWLIADFRGSNPLFGRLAGVNRSGTRRAFFFIPVQGDPRIVGSVVDGHMYAAAPWPVDLYRGRAELEELLRDLLGAARAVAMEYSPRGENPVISRVDAGLVEFVRSLGVDVRSSGDLISGVVAWDARQLHLHREAAVGVDAARAEAFAAAVEAVSKGQTVTEWDLVQLMSAVMASRGLVTTDPPHAATNERTADPHYAPSPEQPVEVRAGDVLLVDVWGRLDEPGAPYADTTWVAYLGERPPDELVRVFDVVARARDEALAFIESSWRAGRPVRGREVDRVARAVIEKEGYGDYFTHRTGHSLGWSHVHGEGTNLDDLEFPDDRLLRPGAGFTVEPGVYLPGRFGVRLEVSVALTLGGPEVTTAVQQRLVTP